MVSLQTTREVPPADAYDACTLEFPEADISSYYTHLKTDLI